MTLQLKIKTSKRVELVDITSEVQEEVRKSEISEGICLISTQHTIAGIIINENETGLKEDILDLLNKLVPAGAGYRHQLIKEIQARPYRRQCRLSSQGNTA